MLNQRLPNLLVVVVCPSMPIRLSRGLRYALFLHGAAAGSEEYKLSEIAAMKEESWKSPANIVPRVIFLASLVFMAFALLKGWHGAIRDLHAFRQTQTALTVTYLLKGGPWLAYQTPVLGPPWAIPFEFPLYQWLVALTTWTGILPLEQSGRLISILMFLATFYPLYKTLKALKIAETDIYVVLTLYCLSPEYLFWSRTFMIESTALALSMFYLMFIVLLFGKAAGTGKKEWLMVLGMTLAGALAATVKVTTFFAFFFAGVVYFGWQGFYRDRLIFNWKSKSPAALMSFAIFAVIIPLAALFIWTHYCDYLKSLNPNGQILTSTALRDWNFGTLSQKLSSQTWKVFFTRNVSDVVGNSWLLIAAAAAGFFCRRERQLLAAALFALFLVTLATFTNLQYRHNYYGYANGVFLIAAVALVCADLLRTDRIFKRVAGGAVLGAVIIFSSYHYLTHYFPKQGISTSDLSIIKKDLDKIDPDKNAVIVVFGAGWSSEFPYYLGRRTAMFSSDDLDDKKFLETRSNLTGYTVGAIIFVGDARYDNACISGALSAFNFRFNQMLDYGQLLVYVNKP